MRVLEINDNLAVSLPDIVQVEKTAEGLNGAHIIITLKGRQTPLTLSKQHFASEVFYACEDMQQVYLTLLLMWEKAS